MRLFCELFLAAVLVWLGWTKSFHERIDQMRGIQPTVQPTQARAATSANAPAAPTSAPRQPFLPASARTRPKATPSGDWMWDPAHRSSLDRPAYKEGDSQYRDSSGRNYWIDGQGVRHYNNATPPPASSSPP